MEEKLVPKRRFKGHENVEWNNVRLGDNAIIKGRLGWKSLKKDEYIDNGPSMIAGKHIKNGIINWDEVDHIPLWRYEESPEIMLKNNDVIFSKDGSLGNPALITELKGKATINATMMMVRTNEKIDANYFYQILNSKRFHDLIYLKVSGSSIPHLFQEDMKSFKFYAPDISEQQKIGEFFKVLDERIANQERKIAKVKSLKDAYLTEMFPQKGETIPKRRFKGFDEEWESKSFNELAEVVRGASPRPIEDQKWFDAHSDIGWLRISDVTSQNGRITNLEQRLSILGQKKTRVVIDSHLLLSIAATVGKPVINYVETGVHDGFLIFLNPKFDIEYMYQWLAMFREEWQKYGQPGSQVNLNSEIIKQHIISIPTIKEQQKIGNFFKNLDDQIATEEAKLDKLKQTKEAYLEEMFV